MAIGLLSRFSTTPGMDDEKRAELTEHLAELRARIMRSAVYLVVGCVIAYIVFPIYFKVVSAPVVDALKDYAKHHSGQYQPIAPGTFVFHSVFSMFFLRLQLSMYGGLIIGSPLVVTEIWGFVSPGLTPAERRPVRMIAPFSVFLFVLGAGLAFWVMPAAVTWFLSFLGDFPGAILLQDPLDYISFLTKMMLVFGLMFQLPIIMMALGKVGIIHSAMLIKYWRYIVVGITTVAMIVTPSNDPFSMIVMAIPMVLLFFASISLVKLVEPKEPVTTFDRFRSK
jgi:sec-independent protein translocase protein TatC